MHGPARYYLVFAMLLSCGGLELHAQTSQASLLDRAEARLRAIYDRGEFRAKRLDATWLPDSSGYVVKHVDAETEEEVRVRYDVASGDRTMLKPPPKEDDHGEKPKNEKPKKPIPGKLSPDQKRIVFNDRGNLFVRRVGSDQKIRLTNRAPDSDVTHGRASWSPDSQRIAFVEFDDSQVRRRSVLEPGDPSYPKVRQLRFARVGETITKLRVGVVDAEGQETRWLSIAVPAEGFYLGQIEWAGDSDTLLVEKLSRFRDEREFLLADLRTGAIRRIFHDSDPAWVVASYAKNAGLEWIRGGEAFVVLSEMDGWRHAYIYSRDGQQETLLTPGAFDIIERARVDEAGGWFYYYASPANATQKYLYRVRLDGSAGPQRVSPADQPGTHKYQISPNAKLALHTYSTFDSPPITQLVTLPEHEVVRVLEDNDELRKRIEPLIAQPTEFLQLDIGDGVSMDAWLLKPSDFDPEKKYPVLVYVYGEPHAQTVLDAWGKVHADYHRLIADLGYLVVSIDNRGTPAPKGAAWRRAIFGSLGPLSTEEQAAGLKELARARRYVDLSRVAVWGWSGGGSNTLNAMFRKPKDYHVGIAVVPKPQPHLYNAWFQEIYMETRETNLEGYRRAAPIHFAEGLEGDLLIIHGTGETNTHLQIVEGLVDRLIELGKRFDYMAYPNRNHGLREGEGTTVHMRALMVRYLLEHLPAGPK